jgi:hypothetical protein
VRGRPLRISHSLDILMSVYWASWCIVTEVQNMITAVLHKMDGIDNESTGLIVILVLAVSDPPPTAWSWAFARQTAEL